MEKLGKEILFIDGAMGTILQEQGLDTLPEIWNIENPQAILDVHMAYATAGCDIIKANTFGANRLKFVGSGYTPAEIIKAGIELAKKTGAKAAMDIGPIGSLLAPSGDLDYEDAIDIFAEMIRAGCEAGADLILIETMSDTYEIKAAMIAAKENSDLPIMVTFSPDDKGRLLTGADILTAATMIESMGASVIGLNCGTGPRQMMGLLTELCSIVNIPVMFNPNGGLPKVIGDKTVFDLDPEGYAEEMKEAAKHGAAILGGCCGTSPAHISAMVSTLRGTSVAKIKTRNATRISSFGQTVELGKGFVAIGERINPTGKPRLKQALKEKDMGYICREALSQIEQGADLLDVNVGLPGINEEEMLPRVIFALQSITAVPLIIDTADAKAAEAAMRIYNGKPLLNSVNGKKESMENVLPAVKKYGAALVALTLDDEIPETSAGRVAIAERIIAAAESCGIPKTDIVVDPLTMTISTNGDNANITLDAVEHISKSLGACTVLGLSNISFGLPRREILNAGFLILAAHRGLTAAIINTANETIMDAVYAHKVLAGLDGNCAAYVARFSGKQQEKRQNIKQEAMTLFDAVVAGLEGDSRKASKEMLKTTDPMEIINDHLIPALNHMGESFGKGKTFLPQLLMSATAAQSAFEEIRNLMAAKGRQAEKRGKIVLATVKGDIHDIGKNIVKTLLENYNFQVIDLGKNVEPDVITRTVISENAGLVGLSALMTTTVTNMEKTISELRKKAPNCRIMVGGAVLTEDYAKQIGADFYSPDAMGAVRYAEANING